MKGRRHELKIGRGCMTPLAPMAVPLLTVYDANDKEYVSVTVTKILAVTNDN